MTDKNQKGLINQKLSFATIGFSSIVAVLTIGTYITTAGSNVRQIEVNARDIHENRETIKAIPEKMDRMMSEQRHMFEETNQRIDRILEGRAKP